MRNIIKKIGIYTLLCALVLSSWQVAHADNGKAVAIEIHGEINEALVGYLKREVANAHENGAEVILLDIDTWGGFVDSAEKINGIIESSSIPTVAYVSKKAVSAGVMVAISCDHIVMAPGTHMGAAETIPNTEKILAAWVGMLSAVAERQGRPIDVITAMADKRIQIDGLTQEGQLLSVTPEQAQKWGVSDGIASSREDALSAMGYDGMEIVTAEMSVADRFARFLTGTTMLNILFTVGILCFIIELFTAGFGLFGFIAIGCFALYFFGGFIAGHTQWWAIVLFIGGAIMLGIEMAIPGFGVFGSIGIIMVLMGLAFSARDFNQFIIRMGIALLVCAAAIPILIKLFGHLRLFDRLTNTETESTSEGYHAHSHDIETLIGMAGEVITPLRPAGSARINGRRMDVVSQGDFIDAGTEVVVVDVEGNRVIVE